MRCRCGVDKCWSVEGEASRVLFLLRASLGVWPGVSGAAGRSVDGLGGCSGLDGCGTGVHVWGTRRGQFGTAKWVSLVRLVFGSYFDWSLARLRARKGQFGTLG